MKMLCGLLSLVFIPAALAQSVGAQDVEPMLQQMRASGKITAEQEEITRRYMKQMKPSDWKGIEQKAEGFIERNPGAVERIELNGIHGIKDSDLLGQ